MLSGVFPLLRRVVNTAMIERRAPSLCSFVLLALLLAGCKEMPTLPTLAPYKMDIQQGNVVTQEMVAKLKSGMTRQQVRFALGTPLVVDPFRTDRWDYVYLFEKAGKVKEHRHIAVIFKDDKLVRIEGDVVPASGSATTEGGVKIEKPGPAAAPPKPATAAPAAPKLEVAVPAAPEGAKLVTGTGEPVAAGGAGADTQSGAQQLKKEEKPKEEKPAEERGFFGRMLDKLGF